LTYSKLESFIRDKSGKLAKDGSLSENIKLPQILDRAVKTGKLEALFVVDTAANGTVISPATRDALGFTEKDGQIVDVTGAGGQVKYQALELNSFGVGEYVRSKFGVIKSG